VITRIFCLASGFVLGIVASVRIRRRVEQVRPSGIAERVRREVHTALAEGRREMRERETVLRSVLAAPGGRDLGR
jgi:hypothetical protein